MFKKFLLVILAAVLGLLIFAATRPDDFRVERKMLINAPPENIFGLVNDLRKWNSWSPWIKKDPNMKVSFRGPAVGAGSVYEWEGNHEVGKGIMKITGSSPNSRILMDLDFGEPFEAYNKVEFTFVPQEQATQVTWSIHGPQPYMAKLFTLFMDIEKAIGKDFMDGLSGIRAIAEAE